MSEATTTTIRSERFSLAIVRHWQMDKDGNPKQSESGLKTKGHSVVLIDALGEFGARLVLVGSQPKMDGGFVAMSASAGGKTPKPVRDQLLQDAADHGVVQVLGENGQESFKSVKSFLWEKLTAKEAAERRLQLVMAECDRTGVDINAVLKLRKAADKKAADTANNGKPAARS